MRYHPIHLARAALLLGACFGLAGCARTPSEAPAAEPPAVTVSYAVEREVTDYADFTARTAAVDSVELRARVSGYLDRVNFKEGALVKKGDLLFEIDPRTYQANLQTAEASLAAREAQVERLAADVARARRMIASRAIAREEFDKIGRRPPRSGGPTRGPEGDRGTGPAGRGFHQGHRARQRPGEPLQRHRGQPDPAGDLTGGTLLTTIVSVDPMYAYFDVDERTVLRVKQLVREGKLGTPDNVEVPVWLGLANEAGQPRRGTINFVDNQVNTKTGTLRVRGVFANKDEALSPGYFARVRVPVGAPHRALLGHRTAPWTPTRDRRSSTSWTRTTRCHPGPFASGRCTTGCARSPTA